MFGTSFGNSASSGGAFAPSDIAGLKLWLDADAANVNTEAAADFVSSSSEYLSSVSTAFNKGNESFSFGGWVKFDNAATQSSIIAKWGNLASTLKKSYLLWNSGGAIEVVLSNDGTTNNSRVSSAVSISSSVWYFCVFVYDSVNNLLKISVNAETFVTATDSIGPYNPASPYQLDFARLESGFYGNQQQDLSFFYDKALSQSEVTALYNSGNAIAYDSLSAAQKTDLVSWWSLSETSGTRYDQVITSANNLTDNNSVGWAVGVLSEPVVNNSPVSLWIDKSTATNNARQATATNQTRWLTATPSLDFDFTTNNQFLNINSVKADLATTTTGTWCGWFKFTTTTPDTLMTTISFGDSDGNSFLYCALLADGRYTFRSRVNTVNNWFLETDNSITTDNTWVHIAVIQDGVSPVIKINNVVVAQTFSIQDDKEAWFNNDSNLDNGNIGVITFNNINPFLALQGGSQQIQIYDSNLSDEDLTSIYNYNQPPFSPSHISGLVMWTDASDLSLTNNDRVSTWANKGTGILDATQDVAINQPIYKSSGFGTNSKPYLDFDGTNSFLTLGTEYSKLPNHTVFAVYQIDATINSSTVQAVIGDLDGGVVATGSIAVVFRNGSFETSFGETEDATRITQRQTTIDTVSSTTYITTLEYTSGNSLQTVLRNNSTLSLPTVLGTATSIGGTASEMRVGQWGNEGYWPLDGKVSEILIYNTVLTTSEVESVNDYLNTKYAAY